MNETFKFQFRKFSAFSCKIFFLIKIIRDAYLQEGSADAVACLPVPRAQVFSSFLLFAWWLMLLFFL
jgi:hypothetical protein